MEESFREADISPYAFGQQNSLQQSWCR